jgi:SP family arabinose:H+ symporter-like MFS transporter
LKRKGKVWRLKECKEKNFGNERQLKNVYENNNIITMDKGFIIKVSGVAALGGLLFGFDTAIISGAIPYIKNYFLLNEYMLGWAVSSILIGCAVGAIFSGTLADKYGRRAMLVACAILFAVSGIGAGLSNQLYLFILFRLIGGLGVGAAAMVSPMYIAEIAPAAWRGRLVAFYQLAIVAGILLAYFSNYIFDSFGENNWRWMFVSQAAPSLLFLLLLLIVPETPRWLMKQGRKKEAEEIMIKISGTVAAQKEVIEIENSFHHEKKSSLNELFNKKYRAVLLIGILVAVFQQVTGINSILYYAPVIFKETGLDSSSSLLQTIGIGVVNMVSTFIAIGLVDKVGRKKFLLAGSILMGISLAVVALCFNYKYFDNYIVLLFMLLYVGSFGCTLGAVTWVYLSEIFPNRIRGLALSVATLALWLADFVITYTFPIMTKHLGIASTMFCYVGLCAVAFFYMLFKVKETKGRSLEEIETLFISPVFDEDIEKEFSLKMDNQIN